MRTRVHDFFFYCTRYLFVYFFGKCSRFSFGFFQSDHLFAIRTFCHLFLLICVVLGLTISNRLTRASPAKGLSEQRPSADRRGWRLRQVHAHVIRTRERSWADPSDGEINRLAG